MEDWIDYLQRSFSFGGKKSIKHAARMRAAQAPSLMLFAGVLYQLVVAPWHLLLMLGGFSRYSYTPSICLVIFGEPEVFSIEMMSILQPL
ncbi:MAG: hypothetical protein Kow00107_06350 [Planctomycetota bacterium]